MFPGIFIDRGGMRLASPPLLASFSLHTCGDLMHLSPAGYDVL